MQVSSTSSQSSTTQTPADGLFITQFLHHVDQLGDLLGLNVPQIVAIEPLRQLPTGSFGRSLADFLDKNQLAPFTTGPRRKQLHDSVHVLTGYGTDPIGETELQAFLLGTQFRLAHVLLASGLLRLVHRRAVRFPLAQEPIRQRLWQAYWRGRNSQLDVATWCPEAQWHLPLAQVQSQFYI